MTKKILGMAAVTALAFGMFACSGEDGADGINGKDGADGANGVACVVKALKDGSGYKVLCDGDSVGVLHNGADGKDGKAGKNGSDGEDGADGKAGKSVTGKAGADGEDGVSCTVKENKKANGFDIICGADTLGTVLNGKAGADATGDDGESCSLKEGKNGTVTISCDGESVTLYKASCGNTGYDPETQFCYYDEVVGERCKYRVPVITRAESVPEEHDFTWDTYDPRENFCDATDTLRARCKVKKDDNTTELVAYDYAKQYCDTDSMKVVDYIPCAKGSSVMRRTSQFCYTTKDAEGIQVAEMPTCGNTATGTKQFNPRVNFCKVKTGGSDLGKREICGKDAALKDTLNMDIRYNVSVAENGTVSLDREGNGYICDTRDDHIYRFVKIGSTYWMAQNLNYAYTQPTDELDSSSFCLNGDPANCETYGRLYTWSAVIDSVNIKDAEGNKRLCGYGASCDFPDETVKGICPDGWHVPKLADFQALVVTADGSISAYSGTNTAGKKLRANSWENGADLYGFSALPSGWAYVTGDGSIGYAEGGSSYLWSDEQVMDDPNDAYNLFIGTSNAAFYNNESKGFIESLRCIKD